MTEQLPEPLVPAEIDLSSLEYMPLMIADLRRSEAWRLARRQPALGFYMINLWMEAFWAKPAGSLPNDDDDLADAARCPIADWPSIKDGAMRGFVLCSDGRWYHTYICRQIISAAVEKRAKWRDKKQKQRTSKETRENLGGDNSPRPPGQTPQSPETDKPVPSETPLRDGTGNIGVADDDARASVWADDPKPPDPDKPLGLDPNLRAARNICVRTVTHHFPEIDKHAAAYGSLTGSLGTIDAWVREGADLDRDVLPVIDGMCLKLKANGEVPFSFNLFTPKIAAAKARNSKGLPPARSSTDDPAIPAFLDRRPRKISAARATMLAVAATLGVDPERAFGPGNGGAGAGPVVDAEPGAVEGGDPEHDADDPRLPAARIG